MTFLQTSQVFKTCEVLCKNQSPSCFGALRCRGFKTAVMDRSRPAPTNIWRSKVPPKGGGIIDIIDILEFWEVRSRCFFWFLQTSQVFKTCEVLLLLVKCIAFSITKNYGGKKKSAIIGTVSNASWWGKEVILGLYDTKEAAINEITRLQAELRNATEVYEMN